MSNSFFKITGTIALILGVSLGVAKAQTVHLAPADLQALIKKTPSAAGGNGAVSGTGTFGSAPASAPAAGWNVQHCYTSVTYTPDNTNFYVYAFNREGTYFYYGVNSVLATSFQESLREVCKNGEIYGVYLNSNGTIAEVQTNW